MGDLREGHVGHVGDQQKNFDSLQVGLAKCCRLPLGPAGWRNVDEQSIK